MILNHAPEQIECALLYETDFANVDFDSIFAHINTLIRAPGQTFQRSPGCPDTHFDMYHGHDMFIQISQNHQPLGPTGFAEVLSSPYTGMVFEGAEKAVAKHKANIFITVTNKVPMPAEAIAMMEEMGVPYGGPQKREVFETKLQLCQQIASFIATQRMPSAVHWCQSNSLLSGEMFLSLAEENDPTALHIHPRFVLEAAKGSRPERIGAALHGAKMLINTDVVFRPAPMPPAYVFDRLMNFVDMVRLRDGVLIPHGESFGESADEVIRVHHCAAEGDVPAHVELVLERHPDLEVDRPSQSLRASPEPVERDMPPMEPVVPKATKVEVLADDEPAAALTPAPVLAPAANVAAPEPAAIVAEPASETGSVVIGEYPARSYLETFDTPSENYAPQKITRANAPKPVMPVEDKKPGLIGRLRSLFG